MNSSSNTNETAAADADEDLDPREAATLLEQSKRQARRQFDHPTPLLWFVSGLVVLGVYGSIWLSVRGQDPYQGPSLPVIGFVYGLVVVGAVASSVTFKRATAGVTGRSQREQRIESIPIAAAFVCVYVFVGALHFNGFSNAIVYGVADAAAPWIVVGAALAGLAAARKEWLRLGAFLAVMAVGAGSAFAGPIGVWGVLAVAGSVGLVSAAVVQTIRLRRA